MGGLWRGASYARVSLSAENLFLSAPYDGLDPEVSNFGNQPIARNIDVAPFPPSRSFWLTIDMGFYTGTLRDYAMRTTHASRHSRGCCSPARATRSMCRIWITLGRTSWRSHPTRALVIAAATGMLYGSRVGIAAQNGYVMELGILGRESYNFDPADPRFVTELLAGPLDGGSGAFGGNLFAAPYADIRAGNIMLAGSPRLPASAMTAAEIESTTGFVQTILALDFLQVINTRDDLGAPIDVDIDPTGAAGADRHQDRGLCAHRQSARLRRDPSRGRRRHVHVPAEQWLCRVRQAGHLPPVQPRTPCPGGGLHRRLQHGA